MQIFRSLGEVPSSFGPAVASIGNFDGVHVGHRMILKGVVEGAERRSARSIAVTFSPHPLEILRPESSPRLITPLDARLELLTSTGVSAVLVLPFTAALSKMAAVTFATTVLRDALQAVELHEGPNFRFGFKAQAGIDELRILGAQLGFTVVVHPACSVRGITVSSSKIRETIAEGRLRLGRFLLGHNFAIHSSPEKGRGIGSKLTVPTINLAPYPGLLPPHGVYVTRLRVRGAWFDAVTNVGMRPTFGAESFAIESHLLESPPPEIGPDAPLKLVFLKRLREEKRWESPDALRSQILLDVAAAKRYFHLARLLHCWNQA